VKRLFLLSDSTRSGMRRHIFSKTSTYKISQKSIPWGPTFSTWMEEQSDTQTEVNRQGKHSSFATVMRMRLKTSENHCRTKLQYGDNCTSNTECYELIERIRVEQRSVVRDAATDVGQHVLKLTEMLCSVH
jgi:hypothetical protein